MLAQRPGGMKRKPRKIVDKAAAGQTAGEQTTSADEFELQVSPLLLALR